jgi:sulfite oxidase
MAPLDFSNDPKDHPNTLHIHQSQPFNAEPEDLNALISHNITPTRLVYGRNHGPIPDIKEDEYNLVVDGLVGNKLELRLSDLKSMPKLDVIAALQVRFSGKR